MATPAFFLGGGRNDGKDIFQGGKILKKSSALIPSGVQDPQKLIGFDHFVQENYHFFLISLKGGGQDNFLKGAFSP